MYSVYTSITVYQTTVKTFDIYGVTIILEYNS